MRILSPLCLCSSAVNLLMIEMIFYIDKLLVDLCSCMFLCFHSDVSMFPFYHVSVPFTFFFLPTGEVLVPTHLIHLGGHNNRHINPRSADHPHKGKIISWEFSCRSPTFLDFGFLIQTSILFSLQFFYAISSNKSSNVIVLVLAQIMVSVRLSRLSHNAGSKERIKQGPLSHRGCTLCRACCWCGWACRWSIAPSWPTSWGSCSSTFTTVGLTSSSWSAPSPASSSCISLTSKRRRSTWPSDVPRHVPYLQGGF